MHQKQKLCAKKVLAATAPSFRKVRGSIKCKALRLAAKPHLIAWRHVAQIFGHSSRLPASALERQAQALAQTHISVIITLLFLFAVCPCHHMAAWPGLRWGQMQ